MSGILKTIMGGFPPSAGFKEIELNAKDKELIEVGIKRYEEMAAKRKLTNQERDIYFSAFFSALTVAGEFAKSIYQIKKSSGDN